uniref:Uncharacterized protein n=1 Tax=Physcomitrium patens TaxID=3218 RepID=A0A2K1KWF1_PHYPA|nr:hypothetical protein PHYPA_005093 [Physcomitrium patens]
MGSSWKAMVKDLQAVNPFVAEEVASEPFWWSTSCPLIGAGFSKSRPSQLQKVGLQCIRDARRSNVFLTAQDAAEVFGLKQEEAPAWNAAIIRLKSHWGALLTSHFLPAVRGEWVGCYLSSADPFPFVVWQVAEGGS